MQSDGICLSVSGGTRRGMQLQPDGVLRSALSSRPSVSP